MEPCALALLCLLLPACGQEPPPPPRVKTLTVVASTYVLAEMARQVGAAEVEVHWLMEAGAPARLDQPTPDQRTRVRSAQLILAGNEAAFAIAGGEEPDYGTPTIRPDVIAAELAAGELDTLPGEATQFVRGAVWLVPDVAATVTERTAELLGRQRQQSITRFRANAQAYATALRAEGEALRSAPMPAVLVTLEPTFRPLLQAAGVKEVTFSTPIAALDVPRSRELAALVRSSGAAGVVVPADLSETIRDDLARRLNTRIVALEALGSSRPGERDSLLKVMQFNRRSLSAAAP